MATSGSIIPSEQVEQAILSLRGQKVMLDSDLARLYGVTTKRLNEQVRRNRIRFPADFMFELSEEEAAALRSQIATSKPGRGGRRTRPIAFTEQGVAMLSSVLHSAKAVRVNIEIMRAFVRLRHVLAMNTELAQRLDELEKRVGTHDKQFSDVVWAIKRLMELPSGQKKRQIGFHVSHQDEPAITPKSVRKRR